MGGGAGCTQLWPMCVLTLLGALLLPPLCGGVLCVSSCSYFGALHS